MRRWWPWAIPLSAMSALMAPMVLTSRAFGPDWPNHLWLVWHQSESIARTGLPSHFVHADPMGVFFPHFAFYGGTLYALTAYVAALLGGSPTIAYVGSYSAGLAMTYGGFTWLSYQAGLRSWHAQVAGLVATTAPIRLTIAYAGGAWGEFMATSAIPLVVASAVALLRAGRWRAAPFTAFVGSTVIMTGSHNNTLVWSVLFLVGLAAVTLFAHRGIGRMPPRERFLEIGGLFALAVAVNLWFIAPDLVYAGRVQINRPELGFDALVHLSAPLNSPSVVFRPFPFVPNGVTLPSLYVQMPVLVLVSALASIAVGFRSVLSTWERRTAVGMLALLLAFLALIFDETVWAHFPRILRYIQFPHRLHPYVVLCVSGLVILGVIAATRLARSGLRILLLGSIVASLAYGSGVAIWQVWTTPSSLPDRANVYESINQAPASWYDAGSYRDYSSEIVLVPPERTATIPPKRVRDDRFTAMLKLPSGSAAIATNIAAGPYLLEVDGVHHLGRTDLGFMVVGRDRPSGGPVVPMEISPSHPLPVVAGVVATLLSLGLLAGLLVWLALRSIRDRKGVPTAPA